MLENLKTDKKEQSGGTISTIENQKVKDERNKWNLVNIISIIGLVLVILSHTVFRNETYEPNRYQIVLFVIFTIIVIIFICPVLIFLTKPSGLDDLRGYVAGLFMTNDIESRLLADNELVSIVKFIGFLLLLIAIGILCILPSDALNFSLLKSCGIVVVIIFSIIVIIKFFTNKNIKENTILDKQQKEFIDNVETQLVYYKNDENNNNKLVTTPNNLIRKKNNILSKFVNNIKTNLDNGGYYIKRIYIDSLLNKLKLYQMEPIELTNKSNITSKYMLTNSEIEGALENIKNGVDINFQSLSGGGSILGGASTQGTVNLEEINNKNKEVLELAKEKVNNYKKLEGKYKIKSVSEMKDDLFMCSFSIYDDIAVLCYINSYNEVFKVLAGRLQENTDDSSRIDMMSDTKIFATFKKMRINEYEVEVNQRDFKRMSQEQINQINSLLEEELLFKDLTKIIDVSKDHKYIQEYNLLEYLIEYKRIKKLNGLSDEKIMLESIISNIVLLIDSLKKSEYNKTNYSDNSKDIILLSAQKWFNNLRSLEEIYNLNIKLKEFENIINVNNDNINNIYKIIISSLTKIRENKQGLIQLKLQRHKIIIEKIKTIIDKYENNSNLVDENRKIRDLIKI